MIGFCDNPMGESVVEDGSISIMFLSWIPPRSDTQQPSAMQWMNDGKISYVTVC
jgi:hypothetical protein